MECGEMIAEGASTQFDLLCQDAEIQLKLMYVSYHILSRSRDFHSSVLLLLLTYGYNLFRLNEMYDI
jgi:hypothetical protein